MPTNIILLTLVYLTLPRNWIHPVAVVTATQNKSVEYRFVVYNDDYYRCLYISGAQKDRTIQAGFIKEVSLTSIAVVFHCSGVWGSGISPCNKEVAYVMELCCSREVAAL